ncbi:MAG: hypothetical protein GXY87_05870 [Tissierellia bacterium]|nr:hypothetical protein [Tissierellia bacterium]
MFSNLITNEILFLFVTIIGITAIIIEVFVPSFGVIGLVGVYLLANGLLAMPNISHPYTYISIAIIAGLIIGVLLIMFFMKKGVNGRFVLNTEIGSNSGPKTKTSNGVLEGKEAIVVKPLRPSGMIDLDGQEYDAISYGDFISVGETVVVEKVEGNKIYCRRKI